MPHPLSNFAVMRTSDADECLNVVTRHLVPHDFRLKGCRFEAILNNVRLPGSTMTYLSYGTGIRVESAAGEDAYLIVVPLTGGARFSYARSEARLSGQRGVVIDPGHAFGIETDARTSALIWKLSCGAVGRAARDMLGAARPLPVSFDPYLDWRSCEGARLLRALRFVARELDALDFEEAGVHHQLRNLEELLIRTLLAAQPSSLRSDRLYRGRDVAPGCVKRVEAFIDDRLDLPLTIADLAAAGGVSERSLHRAFRQFRGTSPMSHLRDVRLQRIREDLLRAGPGASVSDILAARGVFQFGRFAAAYKDRFGESPSETLRRA